MTLLQYWTQPTPFTSRPDLEPGLEARVLDPTWMLLRQWQMSEFHGEDAGSPVLVEYERDVFPIETLELDGIAQPYSPDEMPLEALVERETTQQVKPDLRTRAQAGRMLLSMIARAGLTIDADALRSSMAFSTNEFADAATTDPTVRLLVGSAPDANALYTALATTPLSDAQLAGLLPGASGPIGAYRAVVEEWAAYYEARVGRPGEGDAWIEPRLEYRFSISVPTDIGRVDLEAPEYLGGRLDWDAFRIDSVDTTDVLVPAAVDRRRENVLATAVSYVGMPASRWWEFEDANVDFGNTAAGENDIGRLLLAEFALVWGNDWFALPVEVPTGALVRLNELLVTDTFGVTTRIPPQSANSPYWAIGRLSQASGTPDLGRMVLVPPALPTGHEGSPIESVRFVRDEMANVAWAVEETIGTPLGRPAAIADEDRTPRHGSRLPRTGVELRHETMTDLPAHWIPLVPVRDVATSARMLVRAGLHDALEVDAPEPEGQLLATAAGFSVHDEEIPRAGAVVTRSAQSVRWYGGRRVSWIGRRKRPATGELRSGLEFDRLIEEAGQ